MKYFDTECDIDSSLNLAFLCGCRFKPNTKDGNSEIDKRIVLKKFLLKDKNLNLIPIILEENFAFSKRNPEILQYDSDFMKDLSTVETIAGLYSNVIFIIHETISTSAELGLFAANKELFPKISLIVPKVNEKKITTFIQLAFLKKESDEKLSEPIYFDPEINKKKETYFIDNSIENTPLQIELKNRCDSIKKSSYSGFEKMGYNKPHDSSKIYYSITYPKNETDPINLSFIIGTSALKIQLLSMILNQEYRAELNKPKKFHEHVDYIKRKYIELLRNTLRTIEKSDLSNSNPIKNISLLFYDKINIRNAIAFFLYLMQATNKFVIKIDNSNDELCTFERISTHGLHLPKKIFNLIVENKTEFSKEFQ